MVACAGVLTSAIANAQTALPIIDMHMHARTASHYGPPPQRMCAPVETMPTWDQRKPIGEGFGSAGRGYKLELTSPATDAELLERTIATMERHNMTAVLGGRPELVAAWMAAAPGRFMPGLDFRLDRATGTAMGTGGELVVKEGELVAGASPGKAVRGPISSPPRTVAPN